MTSAAARALAQDQIGPLSAKQLLPLEQFLEVCSLDPYAAMSAIFVQRLECVWVGHLGTCTSWLGPPLHRNLRKSGGPNVRRYLVTVLYFRLRNQEQDIEETHKA